MKITLHRATAKDLPQIRDFQVRLQDARELLWKKSRAFHERAKSDPGIIKLTAHDVALFAKSEGEIVGFVYGQITKRPRNKLSKLGYVNEVFVLDAFRGQKVSAKLVKALSKEFKNKGCDHIITHTDWENEAAQALYKSIGMSPVTVELWKKI